jgi:hypothetical protein
MGKDQSPRGWSSGLDEVADTFTEENWEEYGLYKPLPYVIQETIKVSAEDAEKRIKWNWNRHLKLTNC